MLIAICGNFSVKFCTEAELAWTLEDIGHQVLRLQENRVSAEEMFRQCVSQGVVLFIYVHTHGWTTPGSWTMDEVIELLRKQGIKTCSFHLDRYWGLNLGDRRESRIGEHPFWKTDVVFTADGGNDDKFASRGVNHKWLPPAVAKRHCWRGQFRPEFNYDVIFVGAKNYHREYPFRMQLIAWLEQTYGHRFHRFGGGTSEGVIREERLNDLYASAKVVVGDSCFAGAPYYWSDRVPETLGRGGLLIHPACEGLQIDGLVTFPAGDCSKLKEEIDYYLGHPQDKQVCIEQAMQDMRENHTYHNRMQTILEVVGVH